MNKTNYFIPSVDSSLRVLEFLSKEQNKNSLLSDISKSLSINKTTCLRILKTLQQREFIHYNEDTKQYKLGSYLIALGERAREANDYINVAISYLPIICEELGQTVVLAKQSDPYNLIYIAKSEQSEKIRLTVTVGDKFPIIGGAIGKSFTANLPQDKINQIIEEFTTPDGQLQKFTENTITDPKKLLSSFEEIRRLKVSESDSEHTRGIYAIACPIYNSKKEVILSVGIFIHSSISNQIDLSYIKKSLINHAAILSDEVSRYI